MRFFSLLLGLLALSATGCMRMGASTGAPSDDARAFTITVENVSRPGLIASDRAMGSVPLSPPVFAVFRGSDPMFMLGQMASLGTQRIAEDGLPPEMVRLLSGMSSVSMSGAQEAPGGSSGNPALGPGESVRINVMARPGDRFQLETMFVQSNDWFYGFSGGGLALFDGATPVSGDVTNRLALYDAGTEQDTAPGTGPTMPPGGVQKPVQDPMAMDVGTGESVSIGLAAERHPSFTIPATTSVIRVTVTSR